MTDEEDAVFTWEALKPLLIALLDLAVDVAKDERLSPSRRSKAVMCMRMAKKLQTLLEAT